MWFRVDDVLTFHPRVIEAGNAAIGLWVRAGAWSMAHLTDGHIPKNVARQIGTPTEIRKLVSSGLWEAVDNGYQFHAWAEDGSGSPRQPTRAEVESKRRADRERKKVAGKSGAAHRHQDADRTPDSARNPDGIRAASASPVPSRPDPTTTDDLDRPVPETAPVDEDRTGEGSAEVKYQARAAALGVDFAKVWRALAKRSGRLSVPPTVVFEGIVIILERAKARRGDRTGLILHSLDDDWAEWQRLIDGAA